MKTYLCPFSLSVPVLHTHSAAICCLCSFPASCLCCACPPTPVGTCLWVSAAAPSPWLLGREGRGRASWQAVTGQPLGKSSGLSLSTFSASSSLTFYYLWKRATSSSHVLLWMSPCPYLCVIPISFLCHPQHFRTKFPSIHVAVPPTSKGLGLKRLSVIIWNLCSAPIFKWILTLKKKKTNSVPLFTDGLAYMTKSAHLIKNQVMKCRRTTPCQ